MSGENKIQSISQKSRKGVCLSCGEKGISGRRRYCSKECRQQMNWVLSLSKGLLSIFNARFASFSFNRNYVILDILPVWSKEISRFIQRRNTGRKPAQDLKNLILQSGKEWYSLIEKNNSRSYASLFLLNKNCDRNIPAETIKPDNKKSPRFSKWEKDSVRFLQLELEELISEGNISKIKSAYKKLAKVHHPDVGGDAEDFKKLKEAHEKMLLWAENPQFTTRKALIDCWSYDASTSRWAPPL